jgi:uncharacterized delta-60 repeat protein
VFSSFSGGTFYAIGMAIQPDEKIVLAGKWNPSRGGSELAVVRYNPNGSLDTSFGPNHNGLAITDPNGSPGCEAHAVVLQPDGKIIAAGDSEQGSGQDFTLVRYNTNGTLDTSFGTGGIVTTNLQLGSIDYARAAALETVVDPSGTSSTKIVVVGSTIAAAPMRFALARYNLDGRLDTTFGVGGKVITDFGAYSYFDDVAIQFNGMIVASGTITNPQDGKNHFALVRYDTAGNPDPTFGPSHNGLVTLNQPGEDGGHGLVLQSDGKIVMAGFTLNATNQVSGPALARFNPDGSLDTSFGTTGFVVDQLGANSAAYAVALQPDGSIVTAGGVGISPNRSFVVARFLNDMTTTALASPAPGGSSATSGPSSLLASLSLSDPVAPGAAVFDPALGMSAVDPTSGPTAMVAALRDVGLPLARPRVRWSPQARRFGQP